VKAQGLKGIIFITSTRLTQRARDSVNSAGKRSGVVAVVLDKSDIDAAAEKPGLAGIVRQRLFDLRLA